MSEPLFLQLPLHVVSLILARLDDIQALGSAILTHPLLYAAYKDAANTVLKSILQNQIPQRLMPFVLTTYESRDADCHNCGEVNALVRWVNNPFLLEEQSFYFPHFKRTIDPEKDISPVVAADLSKTHTIVQHFCDRFISDVLPLATEPYGVGIPRSSLAEASSREVHRVQKALYRFQTYCNLRYRQASDMKPETWEHSRNQAIGRVLRVFSPWVNEQLACIHDYLERMLSESFDEVAAHDVEWGAQCVDWLSRGMANKCKQAYLLYGLPFLYELDRAKDFQQKQRLLKCKGLPATDYGLAFHFRRLYIHITDSDSPGNHHLSDRHHWTKDAFEKHLNTVCADGIDGFGTVPFGIWRYAHKHKSAKRFVHQRINSRLRQYGYVMWSPPCEDNEQSSEREARKRVRELQRQADDDAIEIEKHRKDMEKSWHSRLAIFESGGRGHWSEGDLSQIVWPKDNTEQNESDELSDAACLDVSKLPEDSEAKEDAPSSQLPIRSATKEDS